MSVSAQRKGWNEAMRSASGTAAMPPALQPRTHKRRSDRRKKQDRRDKARKVSVIGGPESKEFLAAAWLDALEGITTNAGGAGADGGDDDSYDELDEIDDKKGKKQGGRGRAQTKKQQDTGCLPKRFKPRSMANILLEEVNRDDGVAYNWLENEARYNINNNNKNGDGKSQIISPARKFCPVTGMEGIYTEPKSGLPYANLKALEQVRERTPPWMNLSGSIIAYNEAVKSIRDEES
jgi:hypothetical protein